MAKPGSELALKMAERQRKMQEAAEAEVATVTR